MRILYVDSDPEQARQLYSQMLSYRGVTWDLVHYATLMEASGGIETDHFDAVLLAVHQEERAADGIESFLTRASDMPIVVLVDAAEVAAHVHFVRLGASDCLNSATANGSYILRRMRMAVSRFHRSPPSRNHALVDQREEEAPARADNAERPARTENAEPRSASCNVAAAAGGSTAPQWLPVRCASHGLTISPSRINPV